MTKLTLIIIYFTAIILALNIVFITLYKKYKSSYIKEHYKLSTMEHEYSKLIESYNIKKKNREEANEKINALHNGSMSADSILPKRKS